VRPPVSQPRLACRDTSTRRHFVQTSRLVGEIAIGTYPTRDEAELVSGLLASAGIDAWVAADDAGGAYPFQFSGGARVLVDESDLEAASRVLRSPSDDD
jgi:Putative prokaryotic signal transducing protein